MTDYTQCARCGKGIYIIQDLNDEIHGERHCNRCGHLEPKPTAAPKTTNTKGFTSQRLDSIFTALEYTRATIGTNPQRSTEHPDYVEIHGGRAYQSKAYLDEAIRALKELRAITNEAD